MYKNSSLSKVLIDGGYVSIAGGVSTIHYYRQTTWVTSGKCCNQMACYNGKEMESFNNFETLDYGARYYDPNLGRWHSVDPKDDWYYSMSPYNYDASNPIILKDPNGQWIESAWDVANVVMGVKSFIKNIRQRNVGSAILDGVKATDNVKDAKK